MSGRNGLWRVADLPTTRAGVERAFSYFTAGVRLGTIAQMVPAVTAGVATSPRPGAYLASWLAAAAAATAVSITTLVRRRPLGAVAAAADFALASALLALGPLVLASGERFGTWMAYQPGYALSIIITASGIRSLTLWAGGLLGIIAGYLVYIHGEVGENMTSTAVGNIMTYIVYALVGRMFFGYTRRIAHDADISRARVAELARREEERRAQVMMHNGVAVMRLLTEPGTEVSRSRLIGQAEVELQRMRSYLRGRTLAGDGTLVGGATGAEPPAELAVMIQRVCDRFADLNIDALLDLGTGLSIPAEQAEALERALESLLLNVRVHARASGVVVHLDGGDGWTLTVRDDGVGFDPATMTAGVGLREVVIGELRMSGLDIEIESAVGEGTTVTIRSEPGSGAGRRTRSAYLDAP
ncbi:signal transduction histidine kinase [Allocatelliglobosispora scoriae]|uniref:histidine kinase n=1 Tax=Allocatelliglobosispora scoriae TaxID=643052 RepID=A0A841C2Z5_9ACTN|nr:ATP-binding protein [Allocatelliglobosispora scoriae]MBB5873679.1 signal transduction histidine kinase [Allocatelliglobosispora scoriae]